ncbi:MAG: outer membrane protein assembly factor [Gemmatimonadales bacterium]
MRGWRTVGRLAAIVAVAVVATAQPGAAQDPDQELIIRSLKFEGNESISDLALRAAIVNTESSFFASSSLLRWINLGDKRRFNEREFRADAARIRLLYQVTGYLEASVDTVVRRGGGNVFIKFVIHEGRPVLVEQLAIEGLDSIPRRELITRDLPLRVGMPYNRYLLVATADTIQNRLRDRGYPTAAVFARNRAVDREKYTANLELVVDPGRPAVIGPITVTGTQAVDTSFVRALLTTGTGRPFRQSDLYRSQVNLYQSGLFRYATVQMDTLSFTIGDPAVPIAVRVEEGGLYRARAGLGYGTNDCFRMNAGWTARNVGGRGQTFDVFGRLSKIGVGTAPPFGLSAERSWVCGSLATDSIGSRELNYSLTTSFRRPAFLSPSNALTTALFAERRSEFRVYQREEIGASLTFNRETLRRVPIALSYRVSYGRTDADAVSFCSVFNACLQSDVDRLRERRVLATLTGTVSRQRVNNLLDPTRGSVYTLETTFSSRLIGSSRFSQFTRFVGSASWYRPLGAGVVLAAALRGGLVIAPELDLDAESANFVPPEQRFYAGGANDVRGFDRNELGPSVYVVPSTFVDSTGLPTDPGEVRVAPTGGNTLVVGNLELRLPSPVLPDRVRWAAFLDAGGVWDRGSRFGANAQIRFTPGFGIRIATPLGPARLDVAYNGYSRPRGALYAADATTRELTLLRTDYRPAGGRSEFNFQLSVGQAF